MKYAIKASILASVLILMGCTHRNIPTQTTQKQAIPSRESSRVGLSVYIDTPFTQDSPTRQIGYGGLWREDLIRTAKHLIDTDISRLVIKNNVGTSCPVQNIWTHPTEDIALIKTIIPCVSGLPYQGIHKNSIPKELLYIDGIIQKSKVITSSPKPLLDSLLTPGMSGSPLFLDDHTIVGIITAQSGTGTEFIPITPALIASRPEVQNTIPR